MATATKFFRIPNWPGLEIGLNNVRLRSCGVLDDSAVCKYKFVRLTLVHCELCSEY